MYKTIVALLWTWYTKIDVSIGGLHYEKNSADYDVVCLLCYKLSERKYICQEST